MRIIRLLFIALTWLLTAAVLAMAVSSAFERGSGETLISFGDLRFSVTGTGGAAAFLTIALFTLIWNATIQKRKAGIRIPLPIWLNAVGFGLLPGAAVWKVFEHTTVLGRGTNLTEPIPDIPFLTADGCFLPSRIDFILALLCFTAIILWLILRKKDVPGNGDVLLAVLCVWGMIRAFTEGFRETTFIRAGNVSLTQIILLLIADIPLAVWTSRTGRNKKSTAFTVLGWAAVVSCETVMALNTAGTLSSGSGIGDLAVNAGCTVLGMLLILLAGKDSRM